MAGFPTETDPLNGQTGVLDPQYVIRSQGVTAQNMAGPAMQAGNTSVGNSSAVVAPGSPNPQDKTPGYLAVGEPGGNPSDVLVPGGQYNTDNTVLVIGSPAGTAGGGGIYPQGFQSPATAAVPNPFISNAWTAQAKANEDAPAIHVVVLPEYTATHGTVVATLFTPTISGGTSPYTVTTVEVDGVATATLPTGFSLTASTGVIALANTTTAGTYTLGFRVTDSSSPAQWDEYEVTVVLT